MRKISLILILFTLNIIVCAQAIGDWTSHTPGITVISVDIMHNKIFAATPYEVFYYNTNDNSINKLSKINGLSDMGISLIKHSKTSDVIFVGYTDANIDIIDNQGNIINIPDIYNKYILGSKTINDVFFNNDLAYVCCGFGIVVIDLKRYEVKDTYIIGHNSSYLNVNDLTLLNNVFYAATEHGIYYADANSQNLADYSQWHVFKNNLGCSSENFSHIESFNNYVVANYSDNIHNSDTLFVLNDTITWDYFITGKQNLINELRVCDNKLIMTEKAKKIKVYDTDKNLIFTEDNLEPYSTIYDNARNCYWAGSKSYSLVKIHSGDYNEKIYFNGPFSDKAFSISASGNDIWVAGGGYKSDWSKTYNHDGFSHYDGSFWKFYNSFVSSFYDTINDITCVKTNPANSSIIYASTFGQGIFVLENGKFKKQYDYTNSSLGVNLAWLQYGRYYTFISSFDFDSHNNMWLANSGASDMLSVWKSNGTWESFNIGSGDIGRIMVDKNDIKWIFRRGGDIILFDGNDVKYVNTNASTGDLPGMVNCFATDNNGTVWIGTNDGVALFHDTKKIFKNSTYACSRILIPRNDGSGQADYLLSGQSVLAIAVDGANNLWFGTNDGVIQTSNDGLTTYHHFTTDNSPLFSNTVQDITIDDDGNVYFATSKGIISYKGTAAKGWDTNTDVVVYPNPVRPEHKGIVGIKGLVNDALVKITTTSGAFVTHLRAEGGQAVWDCTDINGSKVQPGIYLIFVSDETGKETYATKVLIMK